MKKSNEPPERRKAPAVDWSRYADGGTWELTRGVDFHQRPSLAAKAFREWGYRNGYRTVVVVESSRTVLVSAVKAGS